MQSSLSWRKPTVEDLPACLALHPAKNGAENVGPRECLKAWEHMLRRKHAGKGAVIEQPADREKRVVGFGFAVFVRKEFADAELRNPRPGLNSRIVEGVLAGCDPLASLEEVRAANTRGDLQQIVLDASWDDALTALQRDDVRIMLAMSYAENFAGFRISRLISELVDSRDAFHASSLDVVMIIDRFERFRADNPGTTWSSERALALVTLESTRTHAASVAASVMHQHQLPGLGFTQGEKDLLEAATDGLDDVAASSELSITLSAIKKRWRSIFQRVADKMPDLCPSDASDTRGTQKRSRILTYVRQHPEELRPFDEAAIAG